MLLFGYAALAAMAPNVVFILVDDVGYNDVGYHNSSRMLTPHIDNLAKAGVRLTNYYVQPICTPTRAALMTGRYPFRYGVTGYTIDTQVPWGIPPGRAILVCQVPHRPPVRSGARMATVVRRGGGSGVPSAERRRPKELVRWEQRGSLLYSTIVLGPVLRRALSISSVWNTSSPRGVLPCLLPLARCGRP